MTDCSKYWKIKHQSWLEAHAIAASMYLIWSGIGTYLRISIHSHNHSVALLCAWEIVIGGYNEQFDETIHSQI